MNKIILFISIFCLSHIFNLNAQIILNGKFDNFDELRSKQTVSVITKDSIELATDISLPVTQDSLVVEINLFGTDYSVVIMRKNTQFIIYDTSDIGPENYRLPFIFTRTPYDKSTDYNEGTLFPLIGFGHANQDMRGRYKSHGVYFPMYSDSWQKKVYHPEITIPADITDPDDLSNALFHSDGSESILYLSDSLYRFFDTDMDGVLDTFLFCNGSMGMYGASALGNTQYQAVSNIPHSLPCNPVKCLFPIVATNENYNTTLFNNGAFRYILSLGWITGQISSGVYEDSIIFDTGISDNIHSPADYGYSNNNDLINDLVDWFVATKFPTSFSGANPSSLLRKDLDASRAYVDALGFTDSAGTYSRYTNLNIPIYNYTGWWDIFINGQIETFNKTRQANPSSKQILVIGPWAHQTMGKTQTGDVTYPINVKDIMKIDADFNIADLYSNADLMKQLYNSELITWYRTYLGGEPFFIIPESNQWQTIGTNEIRIPSENFIIPYVQFLDYLGGQRPLNNIPVEIKIDSIITPSLIQVPKINTPLFPLTSIIGTYDQNYFDTVKAVRIYITGPTDDPDNTDVGNYWLSKDSIPFRQGIDFKKFYLHHNGQISSTPSVNDEGILSYIANPNTPVVTVGGNNMIPYVPGGGKRSQGSINLANPNYSPYTLTRPDVIQFETPVFHDTMTVIGFPKAVIYAKGKTSTYQTNVTNFDLMVRIIDVYPDGREMFITEGVVNARAREYAKSIFYGNETDSITFTNINNDEYHLFEFEMLPLGHTFGVNHSMKILISSTNFPRYQSNPHIPLQEGEFFIWAPGDTAKYSFNGMKIGAQNAEITLGFIPDFPSYIILPLANHFNLEMLEESKTDYSLLLFPNPTSENVSLYFDFRLVKNVDLFDYTGSTLLKIKPTNSHSLTINLDNFSNGLYFIKINLLNGESITKKVIVNK